MAVYQVSIGMYVGQCCNCGIAFAMTEAFHDQRRKDRKSFYCPEGHSQYYTGKSKEQKLKDELERERQRRLTAESNANHAEEATRIEVALHDYTKKRINNGVCPCCNRSFKNLRRHMASKHKDYITPDGKMRDFRSSQKLTQYEIANLIGVSVGYISLFENNKKVPEQAKEEIVDWVQTNL